MPPGKKKFGGALPRLFSDNNANYQRDSEEGENNAPVKI
jgi:hypothetical protein